VLIKFFLREHLQLMKPAAPKLELIVFVAPGPVPIKPFLEMTGPENVVFAMIVLLVNST
jgi:hypothetical protein